MKETDGGFPSGRGGLFLGLCVCGVCESCDTWPLSHWNSQLSSVFVGEGSSCSEGRASPAACRTWSLLCGQSLLFEVVRRFSQLVYGNLYFLFCLFHTAVVNLDNSVVDLETLQALYENVSKRRFSVWECDTHSSYQCPCLGSLPPCPLRKFDTGALNLQKSGFVEMYAF